MALWGATIWLQNMLHPFSQFVIHCRGVTAKCCPQALGMRHHSTAGSCGILCPNQAAGNRVGEACMFQITQDTSILLENEPCSRYMFYQFFKNPFLTLKPFILRQHLWIQLLEYGFRDLPYLGKGTALFHYWVLRTTSLSNSSCHRRKQVLCELFSCT